jgi:DNA-3-methyladenine glycosylase
MKKLNKTRKLSKQFFNEPTIKVAENLLGCYLIRGRCVGKIVETEAYLADDPASHSFNGETKRNFVMFGEPGRAYIYFVYGNHYCFNVVTNKKGIGEAVLIRALEPISGVGLMRRRRGAVEEIKNLCNGPGKLAQAMGISKQDNGKNLLEGDLRIEKGEKSKAVCIGERVGISKGKEFLCRFFIKDNEFVSRRKQKIFKFQTP